MEPAHARIAAAQRATDQVSDEIITALDALGSGGSKVNALGIFTDPQRQRAALATARAAIERAERILEETAWPTAEDSDAA
jgi:hypothetical protein